MDTEKNIKSNFKQKSAYYWIAFVSCALIVTGFLVGEIYSTNFTFETSKVSAQVSPLSSLPLIQKNNLDYKGAFRAPAYNVDPTSRVGYGGLSMAYNPANHSLFVTGHEHHNMVSELTIPTPSMNLNTAPRASYLQMHADPTDGKRIGDRLGGVFVYNNRLITSSRWYYDANYTQNTLKKSHYVSSTMLSNANDAVGPLEITAAKTNYLSGYMTTIPSAWQDSLGGKALSGWCCGPSIIGRTSVGPAVYAFDPDKLGVVDPVPGQALVYYPLDYPTLGTWGNPAGMPNASQPINTRYNGTVEIHGVAFPEGTRSVLFFGTIGYGIFCYGDTTGDMSKVWTYNVANGNVPYCLYSPGPDQGHSYYAVDPATKTYAPYYWQVWAYDALDLAAVKAGTKQPWEVEPYAYWTMDVPDMELHTGAKGVAYDTTNNEIIWFQANGEDPIFRVFKVNNATPIPTPTPVPVPVPTPTPLPTPTPTPTPVPVPVPVPVPTPLPTPLPSPTPQPTPTPVPSPTPTPPPSIPVDGVLIKDASNPAIYIMEYGKKRPFANWTAFVGFGFVGKPIVTMNTSNIPTGDGIFTSNQRHTRGTLVLINGTVYYLGAQIKYGFPSASVFHSWGRNFNELVPGNTYDASIPNGEVVKMRVQ